MMWFVSLAFGQVALSAPRLLKFSCPEADLGEIRFDGGTKTIVFEYTNISDKDVTILDIHTQCGCASPSYSHEPLAPGKSAKLSVTYDPSHFIGPQKVGLTVIATNGDYRKFNTLLVIADVLREVSLMQARYPVVLHEDMRCNVESVGMRLTSRKTCPVRELELYNDSKEHSYHVMFMPSESCIQVLNCTDDSILIGPGEIVKVKLRVDTRLFMKGRYEKILHIITDGRNHSEIKLKGAIE